jgi:hypothetical protein
MAATSVRSDYRCSACGYGVVAIELPPTCPMCGGSTWDHAAWRPFTALVSEPFVAAPALVGTTTESPPTAA